MHMCDPHRDYRLDSSTAVIIKTATAIVSCCGTAFS